MSRKDLSIRYVDDTEEAVGKRNCDSPQARVDNLWITIRWMSANSLHS